MYRYGTVCFTCISAVVYTLLPKDYNITVYITVFLKMNHRVRNM